MVQRRKQLKPSGPERDRPEANLFLRSCPDTKSPLVALPAEIHGIITSLVITPLSNAIQTYGGYDANSIVLARSTPRPQSSLLYVQDLECRCPPYTLPHHRIEGSAAMESAPFAREPSRIFIGRPQVYQISEDCSETVPSRRRRE